VRQKLHQAAMAERPAFSPEIHQRIMHGIGKAESHRQSSRTNLTPWLVGAAAMLLLSAGVTSVNWWIRSHRLGERTSTATTAGNRRTGAPIPTPAPAASPPSAQPIQLAINLGGVISARAWPPQVSIGSPTGAADVPAPEQLPVQPIDSPLGSPEWLLARLQQPASSARAALLGLMPPSLHPPVEQSALQQ
jgi:hypothetical protein